MGRGPPPASGGGSAEEGDCAAVDPDAGHRFGPARRRAPGMRAATGPGGHLILLGGGRIRNAGIETAVSGGVPPPVRSRPAAGARHARGGPDARYRVRRLDRFAPSGGGRPGMRAAASASIPMARRSRWSATGSPRLAAGASRAAAFPAGKTPAANRTPERRRPEAPRATRSPGRRRGHPGGMRHAPRRPGRRNGGGRKRREQPAGHRVGKDVQSTLALVLASFVLLWASRSLIPTVELSRVLPKLISNEIVFVMAAQAALRTPPER